MNRNRSPKVEIPWGFLLDYRIENGRAVGVKLKNQILLDWAIGEKLCKWDFLDGVIGVESLK